MKDQIKIEKTEQTTKTRTIDVVQALNLTDDELAIIAKTYDILIDHQSQLYNDDEAYYLDNPVANSLDLNWHEYQGALIDRSEFTFDAIKDLSKYQSLLMDAYRYVIFKSDLIFGLTEWSIVVSMDIRHDDDYANPIIDDDWNNQIDEYVLIRDTIKKIEQAL